MENRIVVLGNAMLDINWICNSNSSRVTREDPNVPIRDISEIVYSPGGAGNIAACLSRLGNRTTIIYPSAARDMYSDTLYRELIRARVSDTIPSCTNKPVPVLNKLISNDGRLLCRFDYEGRDYTNYDRDTFRELYYSEIDCIPPVTTMIADYDEFNSRFINTPLIEMAQRKSKILTYTSRSGLRGYRNDTSTVDYVILSLDEYLDSFDSNVGNTNYNLLDRDQHISMLDNITKLRSIRGGIVVTLGKLGCEAYIDGVYYRVPTLELDKPYNPCGCGDAFFSAFTSLIDDSDLEIDEILRLSNAASRYVAKHLHGTGTCNILAMYNEYNTIYGCY